MTSRADDTRRVKQLLTLVAREDEYLQGVPRRLFGSVAAAAIDGNWVTGTLATPQGIDRLESFGAKFARMQDSIVDKLLPALLRAAGERPGAAIDNLNRAEKLGWSPAPIAG